MDAGESKAKARIARTEGYADSVRRMFNATVNEILALQKTFPKTEDGIMYSFDGDTEKVRKKVEGLLRKLHSSSYAAITKGIKAEWEIANKECDDLIRQTFGSGLLKSEMFRSWTSHNVSAMNAFINRSDNGMNLSDRVWNSCRQLRDEMEIALTVGIGAGNSADVMSRTVRQCLNDPDLMFRRFRYKKGEDADGNPIWGRKWKKRVMDPLTGKTRFIDYDRDSYIPKGAGGNSRGVYKSAYKNAMRVARTETNMAYRRSDYERWNKMDFVRGIHIELSNQHPVTDICDAMQGDYPKNFYFSGWHPHCFCYATPILAAPEEMEKVAEEFIQGRKYVPRGEQIKDTPQSFKDWVTANSERIRNAASKPYWVKDNPRYVDGDNGLPVTMDEEEIRRKTIQEIADQRHANRDDDAIRKAWRERQERYERIQQVADSVMMYSDPYEEVDASLLLKLSERRQYGKMWEEAKNVARQIADVKKRIRALKDIFPNAENLYFQYGLADLERAHAAITNGLNYVNTLTDLKKQESYLVMQVAYYKNDALVSKAFTDRLTKVRFDLKVQELTPKVTQALADTANTTLAPWKKRAAEADAYLKAGDLAKAEQALKDVSDMAAAAGRYDELNAYYKTTPAGMGHSKTDSKVGVALKEAEKLLEQGDVAGAILKIEEGEKVRAINEASNAAKAAKRQKEKEEAEKAAAAAAAAQKKTIDQAESADELFQILGNEKPVILQNYEKSIQREQHVAQVYKDHRDEIERKFKEFFKDVEFSHCTNPYALAGYLKDGILNNLQRDAGTSSYNCGYNKGRRYYGHYAFNLKGAGKSGSLLSNSPVPKSEWLKDGEYYRCGVPVSKDLYTAFTRDASGYGDAQIIFRKDRVVTTFVFDNSLQENTIPSLTCDPKICSLDMKNVRNWADAKYTVDRIRTGAINDYLEIQYLPLNGSKGIMPRDMKSITLRLHPEQYHPKSLWQKWAAEGVDIYYIDQKNKKAVLYMQGKPLITQAEAQAQLKARQAELDDWMKREAILANKDISFDQFKKNMNGKDYIAALEEADRLRKLLADLKVREDALRNYIPDVEDWHKKFTIDELEAAHKAITAKINFMENSYQYRSDANRTIEKWFKEMEYVKNPALVKPGATQYPTWEISYNAYRHKRDELIYQYRRDGIDNGIKTLKAYKTKDKAFNASVKTIEDLAAQKRWGEVEELIKTAKDDMLKLMTDNGERVLKLGECGMVRFKKEDFEQARKDAAKWFKNDADSAKAFKEADDYMTKYAQDMWKNLTQEEKQVLWLYTDGSKYINEEMMGTYCLRLESIIDKSIRNGLADANTITSIIEKSPALKDDMWMQSGKNQGAFRAIFGKDIASVRDLNSLVGLEGTNEMFMSCHAAAEGAFVKGDVNTGVRNDVIFSVYMPKGTKGIYLEPIASFGDNQRGVSGYDWDGKKRRCKPSDQVEFLLQRGAKLKITKAYYQDGKWYVDMDLIEQTGKDAMNTNIPGFNQRRVRIRPHSI